MLQWSEILKLAGICSEYGRPEKFLHNFAGKLKRRLEDEVYVDGQY
jgi:hypothetical protein